MSQVKKLLCAIDFSKHSDAAFQHALQIAVFNGASLHLLYVQPTVNYYDWNVTSMYPLIGEDAFNKEKEAVLTKLESLWSEVKGKYNSLDLTYSISTLNNPADVILSEATERDVDTIVLGSHGRKGINRILMGSVAETILRHASCNVIIYKMADEPTAE